jgi:flavodoxin
VEGTTSSQQTPTNLTSYDLIVLGSPINGDQPHQSMQDYLTRVDFDGKPIVLILTSGGGPTETGMGRFRNATINANGLVLDELQYGIFETDAIDRAYTAGTEISLT